MNVNPTQPDPTPKSGTGRLRRAAPEPTARPSERRTTRSVEAQKDAIEISDAAREISASFDSSDIGELGLTPERQREILDRIADGFYQRPDVREEVLRRLAVDLENGIR
jgi:hypothetical protein